MIRRARLLAVSTILLAGAVGVISSTQTWLTVSLKAGGDLLAVPGASALPVLAPLSLAVLALGGVLSIAGTVLRYVFGALTLAAALALVWLTAPIVFAQPMSAAASTVTKATGIAGEGAIAGLVGSITATPWPTVTLATSILLLAAGVFTLVTARTWRRAGRRFDAEAAATPHPADEPLDAIDSWDGLSRGEDPTR